MPAALAFAGVEAKTILAARRIGRHRCCVSEEKKEVERVTLKGDTLRKYFHTSYTPKRMEETIIKLLEQWQRQQSRRREAGR